MSSNPKNASPIDPATLAQLGQLDTCAVANAIETFGVRLRNAGFMDGSIHCQFEDLPPIVGFAATVRIRTAEPPMEGESYYYRLDWLEHLLSFPSPRVLVIEDMDARPGLGSFVGEVHAHILNAMGCAGVVTNGAVRDVNAARALKFQMFAHNLTVSHAFSHVVDYGGAARVAGLQVKPGDLIHGDRHGVQTVPIEIAPKIPAVVKRMKAEEQALIELCHSSSFSLETLRAEVDALRAKRSNLRD